MRRSMVVLCVVLLTLGMMVVVGCGEKKAEEKTKEVSEGTLPEIPDVSDEEQGSTQDAVQGSPSEAIEAMLNTYMNRLDTLEKYFYPLAWIPTPSC